MTSNRSNSLPPPITTSSANLSPNYSVSNNGGGTSRTTSPAISPLLNRRKGVFDEPLTTSNGSNSRLSTSSSRSSSRSRTISGNGQGVDAWSSHSSSNGSRSSSPVSFISNSTATTSNNSPRPSPAFNSGTSPTKKSSLSTTNGGKEGGIGSWWGLKSERKRHLKKDEEVFKLIERKFKEGNCEFHRFHVFLNIVLTIE